MSSDDLVKLIEVDGSLVLFNPEDLSVRILDCDYISNDSCTCLVNSNIPVKHSGVEATDDSESNCLDQRKPRLERLTLNITNKCNLACRYCYANQGRYYTDGLVMKDDVVLKAINFVRNRYDHIDMISFFGGEPSLNKSAVKIACAYLEYLHKMNEIGTLPILSITTNGYRLDDEMLSLITDNNIRTTISIDGPENIHDYLRHNADGRGTFREVAGVLEKLKTNGVELEIEATYTKDHLKMGYRIPDLMNFFSDRFGIGNIHCPIVIGSPSEDYSIPVSLATELKCEGIRHSVRSLNSRNPLIIADVSRMLSSLSSREPIVSYCPINGSSLTVNADGKMFPCFMLMNGDEYCLGSLVDPMESVDFSRVENLIRESDKSLNNECMQCWAEPLCYGCAGEDMAIAGSFRHRSSTPGKSELCDSKRAVAECLISELARLSL